MSLVVPIVIFMSLAIISAIVALETKHLMISIISLIFMNIFVWAVFMFFHADLLAWIQLIVYGGGLTALFLVVVVLTEKQTDEMFDWKKTTFAALFSGLTVGILIGVFLAFDETKLTFTGSVTSPAGAMSEMWVNRPTDLIIQALLFFATAVAIGALFVKNKTDSRKEEIKS
ncbi:MAG: NADH-quinone oxidoreductase subunit J family protein [Candidatus Heimdallarchaeaceae archaeon]